MILSAQSIRERCVGADVRMAHEKPLISPFFGRTKFQGMTFGLSPAGYDIRIDRGVWVPRQGFMLASSLEYFRMPDDLLARVADKSTWARQGLCVQNTVIEPGWYGYLTLELTNHSTADIQIGDFWPIAQIIFEQLDQPTEKPYDGKYQNQPAGPVRAIIECSTLFQSQSKISDPTVTLPLTSPQSQGSTASPGTTETTQNWAEKG